MPKRLRCARCGKPFDPPLPHYILCTEAESGCYSEVGLYGDPESLKFWRIFFQYINGDWTEEEMQSGAESVVVQEMIRDFLSAMSDEMRIKLIQREVKKLAKV